MARLNCEEIRELLQLFPPAWMRRRALTLFLTHASQVSFDDMLGLIDESKSSPSQFLWLASTIMKSRDLGQDQLRTLIAQAPSDTMRRLLTRRIERL